jgi:hypothetical protein
VKLPASPLRLAVLAVVAEDGTLIRSNVFLGLEYPVWGRLGCGLTAVRPSYDSIGQPDGYVVTGYKHQFFIGIPSDPRPEWINPTLWIMKTDLLLQTAWEMKPARGYLTTDWTGALKHWHCANA